MVVTPQEFLRELLTIKMFQEVKEKLRTIDAVLNEEQLRYWDEIDINEGFDPDKDYTGEELKKIDPYGLESTKKTGKQKKYLLLEVTLKEGDNAYKEWYLRGFDHPGFGHQYIAQDFLRKDLIAVLSEDFEIPRSWPEVGEVLREKPVRDIVLENDGVKLTITAVGGGQYDLKDQKINIRGLSKGFGPVPVGYQDKLSELLELLVQKPPFHGYQINIE